MDFALLPSTCISPGVCLGVLRTVVGRHLPRGTSVLCCLSHVFSGFHIYLSLLIVLGKSANVILTTSQFSADLFGDICTFQPLQVILSYSHSKVACLPCSATLPGRHRAWSYQGSENEDHGELGTAGLTSAGRCGKPVMLWSRIGRLDTE